MTRRLIDRMTLPPEAQADPAVLAESVADAFPVASIVGGRGEQELRFVAPATLVVLISATEVQFFDEPLPPPEDEEAAGEEHAEAEDGDAPEDAVEAIVGHLEVLLGMATEEDEGGEGETIPDDEADRRAAVIVGALLERGLLELTTPRSRAQVEGRLAHLLAHGRRDPGFLAEQIADCSGVAEFYADDAQMAAVLASCQ